MHGCVPPTVPPVGQYDSRLAEMQQYLSSGQQQVVSNLLCVRSLVKASRARMEQQRTHEFLHACSSGNLGHMRSVSACGVGDMGNLLRSCKAILVFSPHNS